MHAHTPPFTKTDQRDAARKLYDETSAIAAAQDAQLDPVIDVESRVRTAMQYLYHAQLLLKEAYPARTRSNDGLPAESAYLASFSPNGSQNDALLKIGIGDVHPLRHAVLDERTPEDRL
jgi:hypothetical protein